jgi:hypothetical protein
MRLARILTRLDCARDIAGAFDQQFFHTPERL